MTNAVRQWRDDLGLTQQEAANRLGVTARNFQRYEAGDYPPPESIRKLMRAVALGLTLDPWPLRRNDADKRLDAA